MRINASFNKPVYTKQQTQNKKKDIAFKGYTTGPVPIEKYHPGYTGWTEILGYTVPDGAVPNYPGAYPNKDTKVYHAAPFEIIPDKVYKETDYVHRNDLRLSDVKNNYRHGYQNFARNAYDEQNFLRDLRYDLQRPYEEHKNRVEHFKERQEYTQSDEIKAKYQARIDENTLKMNEYAEKKKPLDDLIENANERFNLLKEVDDTMGEKRRLEYELYYYDNYDVKENPRKINRLYQEADEIFADRKEKRNLFNENMRDFNTLADSKHGQELGLNAQTLAETKQVHIESYTRYVNGVKEEIQKRRQEIARLRAIPAEMEGKRAKIAELEEKVQTCLKKLEVLYKTKYPHWL